MHHTRVISLTTLLAVLLVKLFAQSAHAQPRFTPSSFQLYYGGETKIVKTLINELQTGQVVIIDTRSLKSADLKSLLITANDVGAKVIGYLSIGELDKIDLQRFQEYLKQQTGKTDLPADLVLEKNPTFNSQLVDVRSAVWKTFIIKEVERVLDTGVQGLFLDTVDTADRYITRKEWSIPRRIQSVEAMIALIRTVKAHKPRMYIMQNRGLNLIGETVFVGDAEGKLIPGLHLKKPHQHNPDWILWENAFAGKDAWTQGRYRELSAIEQARKGSVFALGYQEILPSKRPFFEKAEAAGFIAAWAKSSQTLHLQKTLLPQVAQ